MATIPHIPDPQQGVYPRDDIKDHWTPTCYLRWSKEGIYLILEQRWDNDDGSKQEWRIVDFKV